MSSPFGPNVLVFSPDDPVDSVRATLARLNAGQAHAEFSDRRYALLFRPGRYALDVTLDFYMTAAGLGRVPGDVRIDGRVQSITSQPNGDVLTQFWRGAENFLVDPQDREAPVYWAVSQAAPYRRMHVKGDLHLDRHRWASGGFLANAVVEGAAGLATGQQWCTRNSALGRWRGGNWNRTFIGTTGTPATPWPNEPNTVVAGTPVIREKPFLTLDERGDFAIFVPELARNTVGVSWRDGPEPGRLVPIDDVHIAFPGDTAQSINAALRTGKHLLLTPGIYALDAPIRVERAGTVVLGLGLATLVPHTGEPALVTADVPGISIGSVMVDAGPVNAPVLVHIGAGAQGARHADHPTLLADVYCRVGGAAPGRADVCLQIDSHDVIVDHAWLWRADHGAGVGWTDNTCAHGLVVNGDDVTVYGLFNEHFQHHQTVWNGERGRVFFYQSEMPYDPPDQPSWCDGDARGFASYKVADHVETHEARGLGIYSFFNVRGTRDPGVRATSAIQAPVKPGIRIANVTTFAGGFGGIDHPVNRTGPATDVEQLRFFDGLGNDGD